jgi:hypothetical protein
MLQRRHYAFPSISLHLLCPEAEFLVKKPGTKTGLLPGFFVFSSQHLLSGNAVFLVVCLVFFPVSPVCLVFFLF